MRFELVNLGKHQKWVIMVIQFLLSIQSVLLKINITPINFSLKAAYKLDSIKLSYMTWMGTFGILAGYAPLNIAMIRLGVKWSLMISCAVSLLGVYFEHQLGESIYYLMGGYFLCRMGALGPLLAMGQTVNLWFPQSQRTVVLLVLTSGTYIGYGASHKVLGLFVNNHNQLSNEDIKLGVEGYFTFTMICLAASIVVILLAFQNQPRNEQVISKAEDVVMISTPDLEKVVLPTTSMAESSPEEATIADISVNSPTESKEDIIGKDAISEFGNKIQKDSFMQQFKKLMSDSIYLLILFGILLGSNTLGGQNVSLALMLDLFGVPESETLKLADAGTIGALIGIYGYALIAKYSKTPFDDLLWMLFYLHASMFLFWNSFFYGFRYIMIAKFIYSIFNGPLNAIVVGIVIRYFKQVDPNLVLMGTSTTTIVRYLLNSLAGSYVRWTMKDHTQAKAIEVMVVIQAFCFIPMITGPIVYYRLKQRGINVNSTPDAK